MEFDPNCCPVCLDNETNIVTECNHSYCVNCLCRLKQCALCRKHLLIPILCDEIRSQNEHTNKNIISTNYHTSNRQDTNILCAVLVAFVLINITTNIKINIIIIPFSEDYFNETPLLKTIYLMITWFISAFLTIMWSFVATKIVIDIALPNYPLI